MKIDKLPDNLPKTKEKIESAFKDCCKEKRIQIKQRTFKKAANRNPLEYIESALRALKAARILFNSGYFEWVTVPAYSAIYQAGNAILIKELKKECTDHFCLLVSLLKLKKIGLEDAKHILHIKKELDSLPDTVISFASKLRLARSAIIYKPSTKYSEKTIAEEVIRKVESFVKAAAEVV